MEPQNTELAAILAEHIRECEYEGRYIDAEQARARLNELVNEERNARIRDLLNRHERELKDLQESSQRESEALTAAWEQRSRAFERRARELIEELDARNKAELSSFKSGSAVRGIVTNLPKQSPHLLELRKVEICLVKQKRYTEAANYRAKADALEREEQQRVALLARESMKIKAKQLVQKQKKEREILSSRIINGRTVLQKAATEDANTLARKHANLKKELLSQQRHELQRIKMNRELTVTPTMATMNGAATFTATYNNNNNCARTCNLNINKRDPTNYGLGYGQTQNGIEAEVEEMQQQSPTPANQVKSVVKQYIDGDAFVLLGDNTITRPPQNQLSTLRRTAGGDRNAGVELHDLLNYGVKEYNRLGQKRTKSELKREKLAVGSYNEEFDLSDDNSNCVSEGNNCAADANSKDGIQSYLNGFKIGSAPRFSESAGKKRSTQTDDEFFNNDNKNDGKTSDNQGLSNNEPQDDNDNLQEEFDNSTTYDDLNAESAEANKGKTEDEFPLLDKNSPPTDIYEVPNDKSKNEDDGNFDDFED